MNRGIIWNLGFSNLGHGVSLQDCSSKSQPLLLTLDEGYLLTAALPDLQRGIAPLGPPAPAQPRLLGHEVMGLDAMILGFWMLSIKPTFSLSLLPSIKRFFSSSWATSLSFTFPLSAIRVVSSAYLRLLIFLPVILIPGCASSSPAFHMMYFAYKLNKQGDNI